MQFAVFAVAGHYLSPAEFGIYAVISSIHILLFRCAQAGWREYIASSDREAALDAHAFGLSIVGSVLLTLLGVSAAWAMTLIDSVKDYALLQALLSMSLIGTGPYSIWAGFLVRERRAATLAKVDLAAQLSGGLATIAGLYFGHGFDALGFGRLSTQLLNALALWPLVGWTAGLRFSSHAGRAILQFNRNLLGAKLIGYLQGYAATLVVGVFLGPAAVGLYRAGSRVVASLAEVLSEPLRMVCWMSLRTAVDGAATGEHGRGSAETSPANPAADEARLAGLSQASEGFLTMALAVTTPIYLGLAVTAEPIMVVLLGEQWRDAAPIVSILALSSLVATPLLLSDPLLSLARRVEQIPRLNLILGMATVVAVPLSAPFGVVPTAVGQFLAACVSVWVSVRAYGRFGRVDIGKALRGGLPSFAASLAMVAVLALVRTTALDWISTQALRLTLEVLLGMLVFIPLFAMLGGFRRITAVLARS